MSNITLLGDQHSHEFWDYNREAIIRLKPDYLLLEVIGVARFMNRSERKKAIGSPIYMDNRQQSGYNSDAFKIADDLDIPMVGIDVWSLPYQFPKEWEYLDHITDFEHSHNIRETRMLEVLKEFEDKGKVLLIVGSEHLRKGSKLYKYAKSKGFNIKLFKLLNHLRYPLKR